MAASATAAFTMGSSHTENATHTLADTLGTPRRLTQRPPEISTIEGALPGGRRLRKPIVIVIKYDDGEFVVSEPNFYMHASAATESEAIDAFRRIFSGYLDVLTEIEKKLGPPLQDQLSYLRSVIISE